MTHISQRKAIELTKNYLDENYQHIQDMFEETFEDYFNTVKENNDVEFDETKIWNKVSSYIKNTIMVKY